MLGYLSFKSQRQTMLRYMSLSIEIYIRTHYITYALLVRRAIVGGFRGPLQNHMILGYSFSCTESFNVFSVVGFCGPLKNHMILGFSCSCTESF
jgi:hypothetical protein